MPASERVEHPRVAPESRAVSVGRSLRILWRVASLAATMLPPLAQSALAAEDVTLTANGGGLAVSGTLLGYDGAFYRVDTEFGEVTLDGSKVECTGVGCPDRDAFVAEASFSGAEEIGRILMPPLVETFARRNGYRVEREELDARSFQYTLHAEGAEVPAARFTFRLSTSAEGFADIIADEADLVLSGREISHPEAVLAREAGRGQLTDPGRSRILALDALVPVASVANPVEAVTVEGLRRLASGEIAAWSDLGITAPDGAITLHILSSGTGFGRAFRLLLGEPGDAEPSVILHDTPKAFATAVSEDTRSMGVTAFSAVGNARVVALVGPCGARSEATIPNIKTQDYPLTTPVFLYAPARRLPGLVRAFIDYATSPAAQGVIRRAGFIDQFPVRIPLGEQGDRLVAAILGAGDETGLSDLREMTTALRGKARLSVSFRFEDGSADLDAQSRSNVVLLAQAIERGVFDERELSFVGFSDGQGAAMINRRLSLRRAEAVRRAVTQSLGNPRQDRATFTTEAFGEALPMACDEVAWGRRINRRVEVWLG